jgi:hypothetical protein
MVTHTPNMTHNKSHPGFKKVAAKIAKERGYTIKEASAILASKTRGASAEAKIKNPRLLRVK